MQGKVDTLRKVKAAEEQVRSQRESARAQAQAIVRDARMRAESILQKAREEADAAHASGMAEASKAVKVERESLVKKGDQAANDLKTRAKGKDMDAAVALLVNRFKDKLATK